MKTKEIVSVLGLLFCMHFVGSAQQVTGIVYLIDEPVEGAKISLSSNSEKVKTDHNGYFSVNVAGLSTMDVKYKKVSQTMTVNSITGFVDIILIPTENQLAKLIEKSPTQAKCDAFILNYPQSSKLDAVNTAKEELIFIQAYDAAVGDSNLIFLERYLTQFPNGDYRLKAEKTLDVVSWQKARCAGTQTAYQDYLSKFPNGAAVKLAKEKVAMK